MSLQMSSIPHEYYFGDLPGTLQYKMSAESLISLEIPQDDSNSCGYVFAEHSLANLLRLTPNTDTGNRNEWKLLLVMQRVSDDGNTIWLKGALLNKETGDIALMTSTNNREILADNGHRGLSSHNDDWTIGRFRMCAPTIFWSELKNRLMY